MLTPKTCSKEEVTEKEYGTLHAKESTAVPSGAAL